MIREVIWIIVVGFCVCVLFIEIYVESGIEYRYTKVRMGSKVIALFKLIAFVLDDSFIRFSQNRIIITYGKSEYI